MRTTQAGPSEIVAILAAGDEVKGSILALANAEGLRAARFQAIGGAEYATIAYWSWETKKYHEMTFGEQLEIVSLLGDVSIGHDGQPRIHAHVTLGRRDGSVVGGHLVSAIVRPTLELFVTRLEGT